MIQVITHLGVKEEENRKTKTQATEGLLALTKSFTLKTRKLRVITQVTRYTTQKLSVITGIFFFSYEN